MGAISLRKGIERSQNLATLDLARMIGLPRVIAFAHKLGLVAELRPKPALALGASEVTPYDITAGLATIARGGMRMDPTPIRAIYDHRGVVQRAWVHPATRVVSPMSAYQLTSLMIGTIVTGRAHPVIDLGFTRPAAGKTGTTNDERDAWFVGFTPDYVTAVWLGYDHNEPLWRSGAQGALPIWTAYNVGVHANRPTRDFPVPDGLTSQWVCATTGQLMSGQCPKSTKEWFRDGQVPKLGCTRDHTQDLVPAVADTLEPDTLLAPTTGH